MLSAAPAGDYIPSGSYAATNIGFGGTSRVVRLYIESVNPALDSEIKYEVDPDGPGGSKDYTCVDRMEATVLSITLEPITVAPSNGDVFPLYNPCGVILGSNAPFHLEVEPASIPDAAVVWSVATGGVSFVGSPSGRLVTVRGDAPGPARLRVNIGSFAGPLPTIEFDVLEMTTNKVFVYIVSDSYGSNVISQAQVSNLLAGVNDIFQQTAMKFVQQGPATILTSNDWVEISLTNDYQEFRSLCSTTSGTSGVEVYFVEAFEGSTFLGLNLNSTGPDAGCAVVARVGARDLAHEMGHICQLEDVYHETTNDPPVALTNGLVRRPWARRDWNGGFSPQYYLRSLRQPTLVQRLLMCGYSYEWSCDLPCGSVYGLSGGGGAYHHNVGLHDYPTTNDMDRSPQH